MAYTLTPWDPLGVPLDPLGPWRPIPGTMKAYPWPPRTLNAYPLTPLDHGSESRINSRTFLGQFVLVLCVVEDWVKMIILIVENGYRSFRMSCRMCLIMKLAPQNRWLWRNITGKKMSKWIWAKKCFFSARASFRRRIDCYNASQCSALLTTIMWCNVMFQVFRAFLVLAKIPMAIEKHQEGDRSHQITGCLKTNEFLAPHLKVIEFSTSILFSVFPIYQLNQTQMSWTAVNSIRLIC